MGTVLNSSCLRLSQNIRVNNDWSSISWSTRPRNVCCTDVRHYTAVSRVREHTRTRGTGWARTTFACTGVKMNLQWVSRGHAGCEQSTCVGITHSYLYWIQIQTWKTCNTDACFAMSHVVHLVQRDDQWHTAAQVLPAGRERRKGTQQSVTTPWPHHDHTMQNGTLLIHHVARNKLEWDVSTSWVFISHYTQTMLMCKSQCVHSGLAFSAFPWYLSLTKCSMGWDKPAILDLNQAILVTHVLCRQEGTWNNRVCTAVGKQRAAPERVCMYASRVCI